MARAVAMLLQAALVLLVASTMAADVEDGVTDIASFSELDEMHPDILLDVGSKVGLHNLAGADPEEAEAVEEKVEETAEAAADAIATTEAKAEEAEKKEEAKEEAEVEAEASKGEEPPTSSAKESGDFAELEYAVFKATTGGTLEFDKAGHFIRHMGDSAEVTTASSNNDKRDIVWKIRSPLCVPGSGDCPVPLLGDPKCMSFESANWKGHYLRHNGARVKLEKPNGKKLGEMTFCMRPGLQDKRHISFESLDKPKFFLRHNGYHLYICDNNDYGGCGRTSLSSYRRDTTFTKGTPDFFGTCEGPHNPSKCTCARGRTGPKCMVSCPGLVDKGKISCSGQGVCFFDKKASKAMCRCKDGAIGDDCSQRCPKGLSQQICSKNGQCVVDELGQAKCKCVSPWKGKTCDSRCPGASDGKVCGGNGECMYDA